MKQKINGLKHKIKNKDKKTKIMITIIIVIAILLLALMYILFFKSSKNIGRCSTTNYKLEEKNTSKVESKIKELDEVKNVDIYLNVCIVKIIVELNNDVEIDKLKQKMTESLKEFDDEVLDNYDLELFVKSDNKDSDKYPIIVSKHKSQKDFYWE